MALTAAGLISGAAILIAATFIYAKYKSNAAIVLFLAGGLVISVALSWGGNTFALERQQASRTASGY
ncbi:hypothetical protein [Stakelama tenebrarum]|uniref:Uncharacterized protein n=1 Tax=Stakelama tenebrarum TaxID=2711215 RepID=A0A6G6Y8U4_9SPHN|nr:hypothetical protein [Sphingosinithalassobacter tenebrarum]QIG81362.1 hypothetical protein G5C33_17270 [Sphingosinithalassobacter tenebrarum]